MRAEDVDIYAAADKAIKAMNRQNVEAFGRLKMAKWDEINVIQTVKAIYGRSEKRARRRYYEIAFEAYLLGMAICGKDPKIAHQMAEKAITEEWVLEVLSQTDFVTMYRFTTETERKAYRLAEALEVPETRNQEIDKALRWWSQQVGQYALNVTDYALIQAYTDANAPMAEWITTMDGRECGECHSLNGQVFLIDELPRKPHWGCRCKWKPVFRTAKGSEVAEDSEKA